MRGKYTKCGKYSYGPLCNHWLVESVGAFCSFAPSSNVVENHPIAYISTHPFLYYGGDEDVIHEQKWNEISGQRAHFYLPEFNSKGKNYKLEKINIGNDVWLGRNVIITNSFNIGNGVIAGAGAVITKDVLDYAVVVGLPARIIRYRYTEEQIEALNKIAWWNGSDEKIRECYDDFYLSTDNFIQIVTNFAIDYKMEKGMTLRSIYEYSSLLVPIEKSKMANVLGINALVFLNDGTLLMPLRGNGATVSKHMVTSSIAQGCFVKNKEFILDDINYNYIYEGLKDRLFISEHKLKQDIFKIYFLGLGRDILWRGKPQL